MGPGSVPGPKERPLERRTDPVLLPSPVCAKYSARGRNPSAETLADLKRNSLEI